MAKTLPPWSLRFCELFLDDLLWVDNPESKERSRIKPGELRSRDVKVGRHVPVSPGAIPRFVERFESAYSNQGKVDQIVAAATAHHRLLWLHPFVDGNGRVARLMSYAMLLKSLDTGGIWSIARGLARDDAQYKHHLANCDLPRRNNLDGRGQLSEEALSAFVDFYLTICIDQVDFMELLIRPDRLRDRILIWAEEEIKAGVLAPGSGAVLEAVLFRGELARGEVTGLLGISDGSARQITSALLDRGVLVSDSNRAPLRLAFPARLAARWLPGLFPDRRAQPARLLIALRSDLVFMHSYRGTQKSEESSQTDSPFFVVLSRAAVAVLSRSRRCWRVADFLA